MISLNPPFGILHQKFDNIKRVFRTVFEILVLKARIKEVVAGHIVAMVTYSVTKMGNDNVSPMIRMLLIP